MKIKRILYVILGCICLGLGCIGIVLPILPTVPFFLATVFFFAGSQKLHDWFLSTSMYKKHLESYVQKKGMLMQTKISILATVTLLMGFGFFMMFRKGIYVPCGMDCPHSLLPLRGKDHPGSRKGKCIGRACRIIRFHLIITPLKLGIFLILAVFFHFYRYLFSKREL